MVISVLFSTTILTKSSIVKNNKSFIIVEYISSKFDYFLFTFSCSFSFYVCSYEVVTIDCYHCYESMLKGLSKEATLVLSNTRELDRVPNTK